jgi:hypothetical protein
MKIETLIIYVLLLGTSCFEKTNSQLTEKKEFEGKIIYEVSVESKMKDFTSKELQEIYGTKMTKFFKSGNFKMSFNGKDINTIFYLNDENKEYNYRNGIDTLFVTSYDNETRKLISAEFQKEKQKILNRECKFLIHDMGKTKNYYWFDPAIYMNPKNYEKCKFSFADKYFKQAKSPWLKYIYSGENFTLTYTAIEIIEERIEDSVFVFPEFPKKEIN